MSQQNVQVSQRFFEEMCNGRNIALADQLFSPTHVYHDPSSTWVGAGPQGMKDLIGLYHRAVNDAHWQVNDVLQAGDTVITRWTASGTQTGELLGIPATGRKVTVDGIWMHRFANGKIVESWNSWDMLGMLQQLGIVARQTLQNAA